MFELKEAISGSLGPAQAAELSLLVDLEARWENLRQTSPGDLEDLHGRQKAYDTFHTKLVAYNKQYRPAHVPELLLWSAPRNAVQLL
jgi:hypothetical protein